MDINKLNETQPPVGQQQTNGVVTVNNDNNPTQQQRDDIIGQEPDTERLRSERESVQQEEHKSQL